MNVMIQNNITKVTLHQLINRYDVSKLNSQFPFLNIAKNKQLMSNDEYESIYQQLFKKENFVF